MFLKKKKEVDQVNIPQHIAIIMDGNGRWAKQRGLSRNIGHREGARTLKKIVQSCYDLGVRYLTVFAFSTENWVRPKDEVDNLMKLLTEYLRNAENEVKDKNVRIRVIGDRKGLTQEICNEIDRVERNTAVRDGLDFVIALNYGGRQDIVNAAASLAEDIKNGKLNTSDINDKLFTDRLYTKGIPDPDLLIRTSGEMRLSNFLIWQCAYSEFYFTDALWPDFSEKHLMDAIQHFHRRQRRYGGI